MSKIIFNEEKALLRNTINAFMPNEMWYSHQYLSTIEPIHYTEKKYSPDLITTIPKVKWNKFFTVDINGKTFILDAKLESFISNVKQSTSILELKDGWADDEGLACNPLTYDNAIEILINYAQSILEQYKIVIKTPYINLCKDGSIDLEWRSNNYILLLNVLNSYKIDTHYYGEDFQTQTIIKGFLNSSKPNEDLVFWMQKLK